MDKTLVDRIAEAVAGGMRIIRYAQQVRRTGKAEVKTDGSIVTATDREVEQRMHEWLRGMPGVRILGEEGAFSGGGDLTLLIDPLDGTRSFAIGAPTSTVIVGVVDASGRVVHATIGDPATERIWQADQNTPTILSVLDDEGYMGDPDVCRVWDGLLSSQSVVFVDHSRGFKRDDGTRQILEQEQVARLLTEIPKQALLQILGSNGMHEALVANGNEGAAGQITTAIGGPWDIAGVLLVLQAGGAAQGLRMTQDRRLVKVDPLQIMECDMMVSGNSQATVDALLAMLEASL